MKIGSLFFSAETFSPDELWREARRRAKLLDLKKVPRQGLVFIPMTASEGSIAWLYACFFSGRIAAPIPADLSTEELRQAAELTRPHLVLGDAAEAAPDPGDYPWKPAEDEELMAVLFSSGSTGFPKAVALTAKNFMASALAHSRHLNSGPDERWLCCLPLFHVGGLSVFTRALFLHQSVLWMPKFDTAEFVAMVGREGATGASLVPTMLYRLLRADLDLSPLRALKRILIGGASASDALLAEAKARGLAVVETYGLTESCSQVVTGGQPLPGVSVKIAPDGEILLKGEMLSPGYYSAGGKIKALAAEGNFFPTGDMGHRGEHGELHVFGRKTDLIITGGENVFPAEVESAALAYPGVEDCAACGLPDEEWGQKVALAFSREAAAPDFSPEAFRAHLKKRLSPWKVPKRILEVEAIPRTKNRKVIRHKVENLFH